MGLRYPKVKNMMGKLPKSPGMPKMPLAGAGSVVKGPSMAPTVSAAPFGAAAAPKVAPMTLPTSENDMTREMPIELGDPQRLGKIATMLRMGRR